MDQTLDQTVVVLKPSNWNAELAEVDVAFVFGGVDATLVSWVEQGLGRFLVFIEEEESRFLAAKTTPLAGHAQVRIYCSKQDGETLCKQLAWDFVFLRWGYFRVEGASEENACSFFLSLQHYHLGVDLLASETSDMGLKVLSNVLANLDLLPHSKYGPSLKGAFKGMTAIICGAGASLNTVIPDLVRLRDQAVIIAGGSAIKALTAQKMTPHLMAALDPDPVDQGFLPQGNLKLPFFTQSRFSHQLLKKVEGSLVWMPSMSVIPLESYALAECGLPAEPFDAGWTVANFCTALAVHLGFERILFAGVDFAFSKGKVYASSLPANRHEEGVIEIQKGVFSKKDWLMSADWTHSCIENNPSIQWGALSSLAGSPLRVPEVSVEGLLQKDVLNPTDLYSKVQGLIAQAEETSIPLASIQAVRFQVKRSFEEAKMLCQKLLKVWEQFYPGSPLEDASYVLLQHDLEQELCCEKCLIPLWQVWKYSILRNEHNPLAKELHRLLFFQQAIETHLSYLRM